MTGDRLTRKQAIRAKCLECSGGVLSEVRKCPVSRCPLWMYRMGAEKKEAAEDQSVEEIGIG